MIRSLSKKISRDKRSFIENEKEMIKIKKTILTELRTKTTCKYLAVSTFAIKIYLWWWLIVELVVVVVVEVEVDVMTSKPSQRPTANGLLAFGLG